MNRKRFTYTMLLLTITATNFCAAQQSLVAPEAKVEKLTGGFSFTEGPAADAEGNIYFTDIPNNRIHKWSLDGKISIFRENSDGANGLFFDKDGNLIACQGGGRRLVSITAKNEVTILAEKYQDKRFNSLNDLWIDPKGGVYFTDPRYGNRNDMEQDGEHVYYLSADRKKLVRVIDDMVRPNGLIGTPDGKTLYVADAGDGKTISYTINDDGSLSNKKLFAPEGSDGMTIDNEGNIYLTTNAVAVYNSKGQKTGEIQVPERPSNLTFGGKDNQTLFITARTSLYSVRMRVKGAEQKQDNAEKKFVFIQKLEIGQIPVMMATPSLVGKPLPELEKMEIELPDDAADKMLLVCFWDMNQRPSRYCITELAKNAELLAQKDITVACIQAADIDKESLNKWLKDNSISFTVGRTLPEFGKSRFDWGVKSLPWLILTDRMHIVTSEGFGPGELKEKITAAEMTPAFEQDIIETNTGDLRIICIGHGTLMFTFGGKVIDVDPVGREADYSKMPKADIILITHDHGDHLDPETIEIIREEDTKLVITETCAERVSGGIIMKNADTQTIQGLKIEAVPAYNIVHMRSGNNPYHPKGIGNGYIITFGDKRVYIAGDTENTPEMKQLKDIDIAFLPMNLPYTMTPEMVADAAKAFKPKILYPYHFGQTDTSRLVDLLKDAKDIEVRIRKME
ncbi:MAG: SMP-30/gluconolactonase/LRE family protein [Sedimentisphaerales bacterium]|nr:SMP-30/gluconolactonase/LRE family protein [Sedimentisphaerales bacterium]